MFFQGLNFELIYILFYFGVFSCQSLMVTSCLCCFRNLFEFLRLVKFHLSLFIFLVYMCSCLPFTCLSVHLSLRPSPCCSPHVILAGYGVQFFAWFFWSFFLILGCHFATSFISFCLLVPAYCFKGHFLFYFIFKVCVFAFGSFL